MDSMVWGSSPCIRSITRIAMSQSEEPRERRFVKDSWPGVSMTSRPGTLISKGSLSCMHCVCIISVSRGNCVAPICCVIPPASPSCTLVWRILSSSLVFPVSTWPMITAIGERRLSGLRAFLAASSRARRFLRACSLRMSSSAALRSISSRSRSSSSRFSRISSSRRALSRPCCRSLSCSCFLSTSMRSSTSVVTCSLRVSTFSVILSRLLSQSSSASQSSASSSCTAGAAAGTGTDTAAAGTGAAVSSSSSSESLESSSTSSAVAGFSSAFSWSAAEEETSPCFFGFFFPYIIATEVPWAGASRSAGRTTCPAAFSASSLS